MHVASFVSRLKVICTISGNYSHDGSLCSYLKNVKHVHKENDVRNQSPSVCSLVPNTVQIEFCL